jgi:hypothetical protein
MKRNSSEEHIAVLFAIGAAANGEVDRPVHWRALPLFQHESDREKRLLTSLQALNRRGLVRGYSDDRVALTKAGAELVGEG